MSSRTARFVRARLAAYRRREAARRRLALPIVNRAALVTVTAARHLHTALNLSWRLHTVVRRISMAAGRTHSPAGPPPALLGAAGAASSTPAPQVTAPARPGLPLRLVARMTRVEVPPTSRTAAESLARTTSAVARSAARRPQSSEAWPVVKTAATRVATPAAATAALRDHTRASETAESRTKSVPATRAPATPFMDNADLQRLASRVIASIDDRIAAARERLGSL